MKLNQTSFSPFLQPDRIHPKNALVSKTKEEEKKTSLYTISGGKTSTNIPPLCTRRERTQAESMQESAILKGGESIAADPEDRKGGGKD